MSNSSGGIYQSNSGSMSGGMQVSIGNSNQQTINNHEESAPANILTQAEVVDLLAQIEQLIHNAELPGTVKEKTGKYVEDAKVEAEKKEPDKQIISTNLERVAKNLEQVDKTVESSKRIFDKVLPLVIKLAGWLGAAAGSLWTILP